MQPSIVVFEEGPNTVVHGFSLASFATRKDRWSMKFDVPTLDDLPTSYASHEIYTVTDPDEMAIAEPCADDIPYLKFKRRILGERVITKFAPLYATPAMYRQFGQQIVLRGERLPWAKEIVDECLRKLDTRHNPVRLVAFEKPAWVYGPVEKVSNGT